MVNEGSTATPLAGAFLLRPPGDPPAPCPGLAGLVLDLAGSIGLATERTDGDRRIHLLARVGEAASPAFPGELRMAATLGVEAVVLAESVGRAIVEEAGARLAVLEAELDLPDTGIGIVPCIDGPAGLLRLPELATARLPRLRAVLVDPDLFASRVGVAAPDSLACRHLLAVAVAVAAAAGVPALAVSTGGPDFPARCAALRRDGFAGVLLRRPEDVPSAAATFARA